MTSKSDADFIIIGAGISGCVIASQLSRRSPHSRIILIEAGPDVSNDPRVADAALFMKTAQSELNWKFPSTPQKHLNDRVCYNAGGKALGGGSAINYGTILF